MEQNTGNKLATKVIITKTLGGKSEEKQYAVGHYVGGIFIALSAAEIVKLNDVEYQGCIYDTKRYIAQAEGIDDIDSIFTNEPLSEDTVMCPVVVEEASVMRMTTTKGSLSFSVAGSGELKVDWGDGVEEVITNPMSVSHTYLSNDVPHDVVITGKLTTLICSYNQITSLDVSKNTALTKLGCINNELTSLDVSKNTALTYLGCILNKITSLDVSKNTALTNLECSNNELTSLDVSKNTALTKLSCSNNELTSLDVSKNTALTDLRCNGNQLTSLDVSKNTALTYLECSNNQLTFLDVSKNTALTDLRCSDNQITSLDVSKNTALTKLSCSGNQLTSLDVSMNLKIETISCHLTPFINNESALKALANTLPQREASNKGTLHINDDASAVWIQSICDAKNWVIK